MTKKLQYMLINTDTGEVLLKSSPKMVPTNDLRLVKKYYQPAIDMFLRLVDDDTQNVAIMLCTYPLDNITELNLFE